MSEWTPTTCMRCAVGCGHLQQGYTNNYGLDTVRGDASHPVNRGLACQRAGVSETADPDGDWLTRPLVRGGRHPPPTSWETAAIGTVVSHIEDALAETRDGVAVLGSGQQTNEAAYALGKLARGGFGTRYYDANTTLCMASAVTAYYQAFGSDAPPPTYEDIPDAETHVIWGESPGGAPRDVPVDRRQRERRRQRTDRRRPRRERDPSTTPTCTRRSTPAPIWRSPGRC